MIIIRIAISLLNLIYLPFKLLPQKKKITFLSRQSNEPSVDAVMLDEVIRKISPEIETVMLFKKLDKKFEYCLHILKQMYHIATSKVVILDSYIIAVSVLNHKKNLSVIQMWHALGSLKKFGLSIVGKTEGSSEKISKAFKMHENYDVVFTSSSKCKTNFAEAFGYSEDKLEIMSLPRVDLLLDNDYRRETAEKILNDYPELSLKKNIVYAPTFRKNKEKNTGAGVHELLNNIDTNNYNLIIKAHPLEEISVQKQGVLVDKKYSSLEMFAIADYIILDYSALVYEAALIGKPLFFYAYDLCNYLDGRDFYIDYKNEMPGIVSDNPKEIIKAIYTDNYDIDKVKEFAMKYVEKQEKCTEEMAAYVVKKMRRSR